MEKNIKINRNQPMNQIKQRTLTLILTRKCNLNCSYCYEKSSLMDGKSMEISVAKGIISEYLNDECEYNKVIIDFLGGEPLIEFQLLKNIVEWCKSRSWKNDYIFMLGTNGTLLNDDMKNWFIKYKDDFQLGLSIDGNREAHNINRNGSFDLIEPHIDFFKAYWPNQPAKMTISSKTIPLLADSIIYLENKALYFTANLPFENIWGTVDEKKELLKVYKEQLDVLIDYYVDNSDKLPISPILSTIPIDLGLPGFNKFEEYDCIRYCGAGHEMATIDVDGKIYPCHRFLPWVTGKAAPIEPVNRQTLWKPEICNKCNILKSCPTCAGYNWEENNDTAIRTTYHCEAHKLEVLAAAKIAAYRFKKLPLSELNSMTREQRIQLNNRVKSLLVLINEGI